MNTPPFRLARTPALTLDLDAADGPRLRAADACCTPATQTPPSRSRRTRLAELDGHLHCSIIGTCLSTHELRKLVPRFTDLDRQRASDLEIHHAAVELAIEGGGAAKALHKLLDEHYASAIRRFDNSADEDALLALWDDALKSGDIPPAYWALMTHPYATLHVRQKAFGDLHMLSHLVGAANRADIRRLVALEAENAGLKEKIEQQQSRLQEAAQQHDTAIKNLQRQIAELTAQHARTLPADAVELETEVQRLRDRLNESDQRVALHTSRREAAEQRLQQEQAAAQALRKSRDHTLGVLQQIQAECDALERAALDTADQTAPPSSDPGRRGLQQGLQCISGKRIVYVGGRPGSNAALKRLAQAAGADLIVHDGGLEDRKGLLTAALPGADIVVFPVDCIDHDSMNTLKRVCERNQIDYHPLRTASVASFVELMTRLHPDDAMLANHAPPSAFCLRHG